MFRRVALAALIVVGALASSGSVAAADATAAAVPMTGIDVASYQHPNGAPIDWNQVRGAGHGFAYVKATEGTTYTNPYFAGDWPGIGNAGLLRGAYHYARPQWPLSTAVDQARYFVSRTGSMSGVGDLPPMLDLEDTGSALTSSQIVEWSRIWLGEVERLSGRRPIIYTGRWYWSGYLASNMGLSDYRLWLSDYNGQAAPTHTIPGWNWTIWQYTSSGRVPGIIGNVDTNRFCCPDSNLFALAGPGTNGAAGNPFGSMDTATKANGEITVSGWAIDPDTTGPVKVHVYANGHFKAEVTASTNRPDVGSAFPGWGSRHGYTARFAATGDQHVCAYVINTGIGNSNPVAGCRGVSGSPIGNIDRVASIPGGLRVTGWAFDPDVVGPVEVHVYANGRLQATTTTAASRGDVVAAFGLAADSAGFQVDVPATGPTEVCAYALNRPSGPNPRFGCRKVNAPSIPVGNVDVATTGASGLRIAGWALDPDTAAPIDVHVYDNGRFVTSVRADGARADIERAFLGFGAAHGFDVTIPEPLDGNHEICVYAINHGPGTTNPRFGCRVLAVQGGPFGALDTARKEGAGVRIQGWALDTDAGTSPIQLRVERSGGPSITLTADGSRADIGRAFPSSGPNHGFDVLVPSAAGESVCVVALGVGAGPERRTIACFASP